MNKKREKIFTLISVGLLAGLSLFVFLRPQKSVSVTENRALTTRSSLLQTSFLDASFQDTLEDLLIDQFPLRDALVQGKKKVDFTVTRLLRGSTKGDPETLLTPMETGNRWQLGSSDYMIYYPITENETTLQHILERVEEINELARDYPEVDMYIYRPYQAQELNFFDEANGIVSKGQEYNRLLAEKAEVPVAFLQIVDLDDYKQLFYASDHHWNYKGAYRGYTEILQLMGVSDPLSPKEEFCLPAEKPFYGTHGNATGRVLPGDRFCVYTFDFPPLSVTTWDGEKIEDILNPNVFASDPELAEDEYYYNAAYSTYGDHTLITNEQGEREILIVGDSYTQAVAELLASHFHHTWILRPEGDPLNYDAFLKEHPVDKILFMYTIENYFMASYESYAIGRGN